MRTQSEHFLNPVLVQAEFPTDGETGPSEDDSRSAKREHENEDGSSAQNMYQLLDAVNSGQSL